MAPAIEHRERKHRHASDSSESPIRSRRRSSPERERSPASRKSSPRRERSPGPRKSSPRRERSPLPRKSSPRRERSPAPRKSSPRRELSPAKSSPRGRSPTRTTTSRKNKSLVKEKAHERARSPKNARPRSPGLDESSRSPSPHTIRLKRAQAEREADKLAVRKRGRSSVREEHDKGGLKERHEDRDASTDRNSTREKNKGGSSKSSRLAHSISLEERNRLSRYSSRSPTRASKAGAHNEVEAKPHSAEHDRDLENDSFSKMQAAEEALEAKEKQKPSFELSGKLAEETNRVRGVALLFNEPPEARKPETRWRLYVFKAGEVLNEYGEYLFIGFTKYDLAFCNAMNQQPKPGLSATTGESKPDFRRTSIFHGALQSCYLFGRERRVADIPTDHPSCSKQHAVLQYRLLEKEQPDGLMTKQVRPYVMDLGSTNGTFINDNRIEPQRYYELFEKDTIKFGNSSREYVLLHEHSAG